MFGLYWIPCFRELIENVVGKVVAVVGLLGGYEMLQEAGDGEVEGELAVDLF